MLHAQLLHLICVFEIVRGLGFSPLHKVSSAAAKADTKLYELLVLVDAICAGRAREQSFAIGELKKRLSS